MIFDQSRQRCALFVATVLTLASTADAQTAAELYAALPETSLMTLSPDGSLIAFRSTADDQDSIAVFDLDKNETLVVQPIGKSDLSPTELA
ncbi:MAG: hypothetical protein AAFX10_12865, partial [Pseudomonadota bacterium]